MPTSSDLDPPPSYLHPTSVFSPPYTQQNFGRMRSSSQKSPTLQPWLGLRARLFLSPISIPLISLLFVAFRLLSSSHDVTDSINSTKTKLLSACEAVETTASLAASFPHFLATTTNVQLAQSVTSTVHGAANMFDLSITAIEKILTYIVDSYRSLFMCFMELLVRGSLAVVIEAVQLISQAIAAAAQGIRAAIQDSIQGVNLLLSTAVAGINDVIGVFGRHVKPPSIAVPPLTALENITLPHEIQDGLIKLNATLPTLQELKQTMDRLIETPFEEMRKEVNVTLQGFQFNQSIFPTPEMQNVSFCEKVDLGVLDELGDELRGMARWGLIVLGLVALVVVLVAGAWEWWKWQRELKAVETTRSVWLAQHRKPADTNKPKEDSNCRSNGINEDILKTENLMSLLTISKHPLISSCSMTFCDRVGMRTRGAQDRFSWLLSFLTHPASLACLFTGLLGLLSVWLQTILIHRLTHHYTDSISTSLSHLTTDVITLVNDHSRNASHAFSASANEVILQVESELNSHVFTWVNTTTSTMNTTLNQFLDGITDALTSTFGGTPLNVPLQTFVQCIVGQKVKGIEKALTWIHDHAYVNFTLVPDDVLMLKPAQQDAVLRPVKEAMLGNGQDAGDGMVGHVVSKYLKHLDQEKVMFAVLVAIYGLILVIGLMVIAYATLADRDIDDDDRGGGTNAKDSHGRKEEEDDEKLRTSLQDGPSAPFWWSRFRNLKSKDDQQDRASSTSDAKPIRPRSVVNRFDPPSRRISIANSNRSNRAHVTKDSISYPFQIHHSLTTSSPRQQPRQPTHLRQQAISTTTDTISPSNRDTVLSLIQHTAPSHSPPQQEATVSAAAAPSTQNADTRSSWLSFLASHSTEHGQAAASRAIDESAQERFERLFGCFPVASPTTPSFGHHLSAPPLTANSSTQVRSPKGEQEQGYTIKREKESGRYRQTLDLMPNQEGWIGSKSPVPPVPRQEKETGGECMESATAEVQLRRGNAMGGEPAVPSENGRC